MYLASPVVDQCILSIALFLKMVWALLDVITIIVLASGLYLWVARVRAKRPVAGRGPVTSG